MGALILLRAYNGLVPALKIPSLANTTAPRASPLYTSPIVRNTSERLLDLSFRAVSSTPSRTEAPKEYSCTSKSSASSSFKASSCWK